MTLASSLLDRVDELVDEYDTDHVEVEVQVSVVVLLEETSDLHDIVLVGSIIELVFEANEVVSHLLVLEGDGSLHVFIQIKSADVVD
jgi:hypothetical protein